jgi:hypothetical protein
MQSANGVSAHSSGTGPNKSTSTTSPLEALQQPCQAECWRPSPTAPPTSDSSSALGTRPGTDTSADAPSTSAGAPLQQPSTVPGRQPRATVMDEETLQGIVLGLVMPNRTRQREVRHPAAVPPFMLGCLRL